MKKSISWEDYMVLKLNEALSGKSHVATPEFMRQMRENRRKKIEARQKSLENDSSKK